MGKKITTQKNENGSHFSYQISLGRNRLSHRNSRIIQFFFITLMLFFLFVPVFADNTSDMENGYAAGELLVKIRIDNMDLAKKDTLTPSLERLNQQFGAIHTETLFTIQTTPPADTRTDLEASGIVYEWLRISFPPNTDVQLIAQAYRDDPEIEYVEFNYIYHTCMIPDDPYFSSSGSWGANYDDLWGMKKIQAEQAWDISTGSQDMAVAVVDTGVDPTHEDLQENMWTNPEDGGFGWNFLNFLPGSSDAPYDDYGHGTHVAGIIGAVGNNGKGVVGVNWRCKIMAIKTFDQFGQGIAHFISLGIIWATDHGARVINCSFCGTGYSQMLWDAIDYAHSQNCVVVAAAGNNNEDVTKFYPAGYNNVITVAATDQNDMRSTFSNYGLKIEVGAPGGGSTDEDDTTDFTYVNVLSLRAADTDMYGFDYPPVAGIMIVDEQYYRARGTSMAAPHVTGLAALMLSLNPDLTNEEVRAILKYSADDIDAPGWDEYTGYGRINAYNALQYDSAPLMAHIDTQRLKPIIGYSPTTIQGTARGSEFCCYEISMKNMESGREDVLVTGSLAVDNGELGTLNVPFWYPEGEYLLTLSVYSHDRALHDNILVDVVDLVPGWPRDLELPTYPTGSYLSINLSPIAVADSGNHNGKIIVAADANRKLYVWKPDGTNYNTNWPTESLGAKQRAEGDVYMASPAIGDINGDHQPEIVYCCDRQIHVLNLEDASELPGWPKSLDEDISAWALADINHGCRKQLVVTSTSGIHVFDETGNELPGWPAVIMMSNDILAIADLNYDGKDDIIVASQGDASTVVGFDSYGNQIFETEEIPGIKEIAIGNVSGNTALEVVVYSQSPSDVSQVSVYDHTGCLNNFWIVQDGSSRSSFSFYNYSLSLGNVSGNPFVQEIIISEYTYASGRIPGYQSEIFIYDGYGELIEGWPISFDNEISSCFMADINLDLKNEIVMISQLERIISNTNIKKSTVYIYSPNGSPYEQGWPKNLFDYDGSGENTKSSVTIADMNCNGKLELLAACGNSVYAIKLRGSRFYGYPAWPMPMHDPGKTRAITNFNPATSRSIDLYGY